jgi:hypothetical protein
MRLRAKFSVSTALAAFVTIAAVWGLFKYGKADYAVGVAAVGTLLSALLPALLSAKDAPVEVKLGRSDPPQKKPPETHNSGGL